ncbi:type II toxin-antitoxin system PemK/MazF family toxin [Prauserella halophila]|uniref:Type II toxin-antitoxin system PemK/MazF family toxin n=1 Tax=Prauserella halophila TaxID=185641 RepID=A0ABN1WCB4_9PSEU|nr:mRNA interferase MazF [Prauserella halophila]
MNRGEVWTAAAKGAYTGKPRPVVIVQSDAFDGTDSVVVCPFTTHGLEAPLMRVPVEPDETNGLSEATQIMLDKVSAIPRRTLGTRLGVLSDIHMTQASRGLVVFLGIG